MKPTINNNAFAAVVRLVYVIGIASSFITAVTPCPDTHT